MTVNERIYEAGLLPEFDRAVRDRNTDKVISILKAVELTDLSISPILEQLGLSR
jgi:hypothetical protein